MRVPDVSYARSGPLSIAYQLVGEGSRDVVWVRGGLDDMLSTREQPAFCEFIEEVTAFSPSALACGDAVRWGGDHFLG